MGLNPEKNYERDPSHIGYRGSDQLVRGPGQHQHSAVIGGVGSQSGPVVARDSPVITSGGMFMAGIISAIYSLHDPDPVYLFYALLFCALGIFLEGYEQGSK